MAVEGITLNSGSGGSVVATDSVSSQHYQLVKIAAGGDGDAAFGYTPYYYLAAASGNQDSTVVKASTGVVGNIIVTNTNSAARYFRLYNLASSPTSASTPVQTYAVPGSGGIAISLSAPFLFSTGIAFRLTTGSAVNDANAVSAGEIVVNLGYL